MPYVTEETLSAALTELKGTADHLLKIWFALKEMGMSAGNPVKIDTGNSTGALQRLFDYGDPEGAFYVPFAHTRRFLTMKGDACRSVVQTTLKRWAESQSVVTVDPTSYLDIEETADGSLKVQPVARRKARLL
jgi:5-methylcytosine-specific restriction enzyme B